jgi:hypothetical protein
MLTGIGDDIYTYINVNEPSIGIVQKKPEFTNVVNGIGVFSSRLTNRILDREFDESTHMTITIHELTKPFNFVGY